MFVLARSILGIPIVTLSPTQQLCLNSLLFVVLHCHMVAAKYVHVWSRTFPLIAVWIVDLESPSFSMCCLSGVSDTCDDSFNVLCSTSPSASTSSFGPDSDCGATQEPGDTKFTHPSALFPSSLMDGDD